MTTEQKQHEKFIYTLLDHWENIRLMRPTLARDLLGDIVDAAIKDIEAGNLTKESHIIDYIQWLNDEILEGLGNE